MMLLMMVMMMMMMMVIIFSIFTLIRLCRPRPGYTIAKVQVSHSTAHVHHDHGHCDHHKQHDHHNHHPCDPQQHHDHHSRHHNDDQDGDIDLGKLAENSNYHTTGATLHPRFVISIIVISIRLSASASLQESHQELIISIFSISIINTKIITIIINMAIL